ncbi:hypothetical protein CLOP_g4114 [Closterium sp. NIES-67]|nr:hypothetical protein CLOP_g4114 [Closterium sp. NIES-67]
MVRPDFLEVLRQLALACAWRKAGPESRDLRAASLATSRKFRRNSRCCSSSERSSRSPGWRGACDSDSCPCY